MDVSLYFLVHGYQKLYIKFFKDVVLSQLCNTKQSNQ